MTLTCEEPGSTLNAPAPVQEALSGDETSCPSSSLARNTLLPSVCRSPLTALQVCAQTAFPGHPVARPPSFLSMAHHH